MRGWDKGGSVGDRHGCGAGTALQDGVYVVRVTGLEGDDAP